MFRDISCISSRCRRGRDRSGRLSLRFFVRALERHRFNRTAAGASLGLSLRQMRYRMARLGVAVAGHDNE